MGQACVSRKKLLHRLLSQLYGRQGVLLLTARLGFDGERLSTQGSCCYFLDGLVGLEGLFRSNLEL